MLFVCLLLSATPGLDDQAKDVLRRSIPARFENDEVIRPDSLKGKLLSARFVRPPRAGTNTVEVTVRTSADTVRRWAFAQLAKRQRVLAARRKLAAGHVLEAGDLGFVLSATQGALAMDPRALVGQALNKPLTRAELVTTGHVDLPAPAARGTPVRVLSRAGTIEVATKGSLAQAVAPGKRGRVLVEGQRRPLPGTLVDANTFVLDNGASR